jgi:hypothetical protein
VFVLILEFSERKMARYLDEALNEPVDDSNSEDVSETEYTHGKNITVHLL